MKMAPHRSMPKTCAQPTTKAQHKNKLKNAEILCATSKRIKQNNDLKMHTCKRSSCWADIDPRSIMQRQKKAGVQSKVKLIMQDLAKQ